MKDGCDKSSLPVFHAQSYILILQCLPEEKTEQNFSSVSERQLSHRFLAREHRAELCYGFQILIMGNVPVSFSFQVCRTLRTSWQVVLEMSKYSNIPN